MIGNHKHILLVGVNDIDTLVSKKKTSLVTNFRIEVRLSIRINIDSYSNLISIHDWATKTRSPH